MPVQYLDLDHQVGSSSDINYFNGFSWNIEKDFTELRCTWVVNRDRPQSGPEKKRAE
ncbi:hypothetical protein FRC01_012325, partial [Tulasnella sp. 417]